MKRVFLSTLVLALALSAVAWAKVSIKVTPSAVKAGKVVTVSGSTGKGCAKGDRVTLLSKAFSSKHRFAGVPAVYAKSGTGGAFSVKTTIPKSRKAGKYTVTGRCGGGNLGVSAMLKVTK
ncbi:MAG TPA: hypothetical protein VG388_07195 [Solirubrobacteraceae bacterium]|jgi:hypothetical protein|nr:hypothetical protein [Solirubrobacteraceae bacterium]